MAGQAEDLEARVKPGIWPVPYVYTVNEEVHIRFARYTVSIGNGLERRFIEKIE
jgi:hypothetical protein